MQILQKMDIAQHINELLLISRCTYVAAASQISLAESLRISQTLKGMLGDIEYFLSHCSSIEKSGGQI